eukprot:TRINITY_DN11094_c0_g1_i2.p1 TRINITY_DN11094_c0_g1~~TRINITY_DN11094_c0_g1_i2.p1  ORF type:complete len:146 (-),score=25.01 TRINITY_DN11094_c0_g1_i2:58-495(-)
MEIMLHPSEEQELRKMSFSLSLDARTQEITRALIYEYKARMKISVVENKLREVIGCAIITASKSQVLPTVEGEGSVRGAGISISHILAEISGNSTYLADIKRFLEIFREFLLHVEADAETKRETNALAVSCTFSLTLYTLSLIHI